MSNKKLEKSFNVDIINNDFVHSLYIDVLNYTENLSFIEKLSFKGFTDNPILNFIDKKYFKSIVNFNNLPETNTNPDADRSVPDTRENLINLLKKNIVKNFLINDMFEHLILNHEYADRKNFVNAFDKVPSEIMFFIIPILKNKEESIEKELKELEKKYNSLKEKKYEDNKIANKDGNEGLEERIELNKELTKKANELKIMEFKCKNFKEDSDLIIKKVLNNNPKLLQSLQENFPEFFDKKEDTINKNKILHKKL